MIFLALPFVFVTFVIQFPAGLLVYWITTNLLDDRAAADHPEAPRAAAATDCRRARSRTEPVRRLAGRRRRPRSRAGERAEAVVARRSKEPRRAGGSEPKGRPASPPPAPPRKKKKRSGRRR